MRGVDILSSWVGVTLAELFWVCEMTYGDDLEAADAMREQSSLRMSLQLWFSMCFCSGFNDFFNL